MVPADSRRITRVPRYSGYHWAVSRFGYGPVTLSGTPFQGIPLALDIPCRGPTTPAARRHAAGLGSSPFARHYWGNHCLFSLPAGTKMFQFPAFASLTNNKGYCPFRTVGCPIRRLADHRIFAPTRHFSQLITSFVASVSQGIRHAPLLTFAFSPAPVYHHPKRTGDKRGRPYFQLILVSLYTVCLVAICQRSLYIYVINRTESSSTGGKGKSRTPSLPQAVGTMTSRRQT